MFNNTWALAEQWVDNTLAPTEKKALTDRLQSDTQFAQEFQEQVNLVQSLRNAGKQKRFKSMLADVQQQHKKRGIRIALTPQFWRTAGVAASVALLTSLSTYILVISNANKNESRYSTISREVSNLKLEQAKQKRVQTALIDSINKKSAAFTPPPSDVRYTGTGFALTNDGYFVTAYHVINDGNGDGDSVYIQINGQEYYKAFMVNFNAKVDLALLKVEKKGFKFSKSDVPYTILPVKAALGTKVFTLGYPKDDLVYSEGYISSKYGYEQNTQQYTLDLPVGHGQSGSPMIDAHGNIAGIVTAMSSASEANTYAITSGAIFELLHTLPNENSLRLPKSNRLHQLSREQQIAKLEPFVFSVKVYKK